MKRIIHVDNSEFFRKHMKTFLEKEGFEVESFDNTQDANLAIGIGLAEAIIMGLTFSDGGGEEFLARILESFSGPVIVISSSADDDKKEKLLDLGAKMVFNKSESWKEKLKACLS